MPEQLLFLDRRAVLERLDQLDPGTVVADALCRHANGQTRLPSESYLPWTNSEGNYCRSIAMLGAIFDEQGRPVVGAKLINASTSNPVRGRERAGGVSLVFDAETVRPRVLAEAGWLSAVRTATYTVLSLQHLGPRHWNAASVLGCGTLARAHIDLVVRAFPEVTTVYLYDLARSRADCLAEWVVQQHPRVIPSIQRNARDAVGAVPVVVTVTTSNQGYVPAYWLQPGTFVAHVSLDDLLPDVFATAQGLFVDDVDLVAGQSATRARPSDAIR